MDIESERLNVMRLPLVPGALRCVFWGALICLFDINLDLVRYGSTFRFDLLNDVVGMLLIASGVSRLRRFDISPRYAAGMTFVSLMVAVGVVQAIIGHWVFAPTREAAFILAGLTLLSLFAMLEFCNLMIAFCKHFGLTRSARDWRSTKALFVFFFLLPVGVLTVFGAISAGASGKQSFHTDNLGMVVIAMLVLALPFLSAMSTIARMRVAILERELSNDGGRYMPEVDS